LYREELEHWHAQGAVSELQVAFSRDGTTKVYVQHLVAAAGQRLWQVCASCRVSQLSFSLTVPLTVSLILPPPCGSQLLASPGATGHLYVCGDAKAMARDVNKALVEVIRQHGRCDEAAAEAALRELAEHGRYSRDVW
jgi:sulfite reductase alpha subunit-like flavoprotein